MWPSIERRRAERQDYACQVVIARDRAAFLGHMDDVSTTGCCTSRPDDWSLPVHARVMLYLLVDQNRVQAAPAEVAWANGEFVGFEYLEAQPLPG